MFLETKDIFSLGFEFFSSFIDNVPWFLPGGIGDLQLLDKEAR